MNIKFENRDAISDEESLKNKHDNQRRKLIQSQSLQKRRQQNISKLTSKSQNKLQNI